MAAEDKVFVVVQEGGSSTELYLHVHDTRESANADREHCANDGSYRTSPVVEVPASLANHPEFYNVVDALLKATLSIDYP